MILKAWHAYLGMDTFDKAWHEGDIADEFQEFLDATGIVHRWSELSDVVYTYTRGKYDGGFDLTFPLGKWAYALGLLYMFPKIMCRWWLFRAVGKEFHTDIRCVRNPKKVHKLRAIAALYSIDQDRFVAAVQQKMKRRVLFP
jgi:hypothetical protein